MKAIYDFIKAIYALKGIMGLFNTIYVLFQIKLTRRENIKYRFFDHNLYINNDSSIIYHMVHSTRKIKNLVDNIPYDEIQTVFDVGANNGIFAYFIKRRYPNSKVYCFEPSPDLIRCIELNVSSFNNVHIIQKAICEVSNRKIDFYINPLSQQTNSILIDSVTPFCQENKLNKINVEADTLDSFCLSNRIKSIDVLKVDIQGSENSLLKGATHILQNTEIAFFEISFLEKTIFKTTTNLLEQYEHFKVLNEVKMGADIMFYNGGM